MRNKKLLTLTMLIAAIGIFQLFFNQSSNSTESIQTELFIPDLIDSKAVGHNIELEIQNTQHEFYEGVLSATKGYSQSYLGPTIRLYQGEDTRIQFTNGLDEATSVHGHGLHVPGEVDGGPQSIIEQGETWDVTLPIRQEASTSWYHPHLHGSTASQVHSGLAGLYIVEDENSQNLPLPKEYGVNDIPVIVQDRNFEDSVMEQYSITMDEMMDGKREDTLVINGTIDPFKEVPQGWVRLRLLNGSNSRYYDFHLENDEPFYKIATEGGFLKAPVKLTSMQMVPGERNEIMIDLSDGKSRELRAALLPVDDDQFSGFFEDKRRILELRVNPELNAEGQLPDRLNTIVKLDREDASVIREFELDMNMRQNRRNSSVQDMHSMFSINDKPMDMQVIDERVNLGDTEIWRVTRDDMDHPFHLHGASFQILSQNGREPAPEDQGWKDTVLVGYGWTEIIVKFEYEATEEYPYMYHCHILEHEDGGMMGQFTVQ